MGTLDKQNNIPGATNPRKDSEYRQCSRPWGYELTAFAFFTIRFLVALECFENF